MVSSQSLLAEIHALDSKIRVLAQRLSIIEKNEQIIGKTLIGHNKTLKELQEGISKLETGSAGGMSGDEMEGLKKSVSEVKSEIDALKPIVQENKRVDDAIRADIKEIKYVVDMINPVAYVTKDDIDDIIEDKLKAPASGKAGVKKKLAEYEKEFL